MFGKTLVEEIQQRKALTKKLQSAETEYQAMIAKAEQEREWIIAEALTHKQHVIQEAVLVAEEAKRQTIAKAEAAAQEIIAKAQRDTSAAKAELLSHYETGVKKTALQVVQKIFHDNTKLQESYVDMLIKEVIEKNWSVIR